MWLDEVNFNFRCRRFVIQYVNGVQYVKHQKATQYTMRQDHTLPGVNTVMTASILRNDRNEIGICEIKSIMKSCIYRIPRK